MPRKNKTVWDNIFGIPAIIKNLCDGKGDIKANSLNIANGAFIIAEDGSISSNKLDSRFSALRGQMFNVKDYGAVGDGVTDDSAAIQTAITGSGLNGTVYFPFTPKSYWIRKSLQLENNIRFVGVKINDSFATSLAFRDAAKLIIGKNCISVTFGDMYIGSDTPTNLFSDANLSAKLDDCIIGAGVSMEVVTLDMVDTICNGTLKAKNINAYLCNTNRPITISGKANLRYCQLYSGSDLSALTFAGTDVDTMKKSVFVNSSLIPGIAADNQLDGVHAFGCVSRVAPTKISVNTGGITVIADFPAE